VILPWMIGRAFEKIGEREFIDRLGDRVEVPLPLGLGKRRLNALLTSEGQKQAIGIGVQEALAELYPKYNLTGKTWADLTRNVPRSGTGAKARAGDIGLLRRGDLRYQSLVPSYTVMFAFFLVLTVGWLFVAERRQGTLKRLRAAPLSPTQILAGKMIPCFVVSVGQGLFLLGAGKLAFGMSWGAQPLWLLLVVFATSLAATGMALLVAALARTEAQVAVYGTLLVIVLAGASGCLRGDPELMPEKMKAVSRITPHAWALDAYAQLLVSTKPNLGLVGRACAVLTAFGAGFVALAWSLLRLE
jgi:linearmycin/streptolysin S transport system permease protein